MITTCNHVYNNLLFEFTCSYEQDSQTVKSIAVIPKDATNYNSPSFLDNPVAYVDKSICNIFEQNSKEWSDFENVFKSKSEERIPLSFFKRYQIVEIFKNLENSKRISNIKTVEKQKMKLFAATCIDPNSKGILIQKNPDYKG